MTKADIVNEIAKNTALYNQAIIADNEGVFTDIPLKISANWHK